jgi:hypothetical protein
MVDEVRLLQMISFIVKLSTLPELPEHCQPAIGQTTIDVMLGCTTGSKLLTVGNGPDRLAQGAAGPLLGNVPKLLVTSLAKLNDTSLTTGRGHWAGASQGLEAGGARWKTSWMR